MPRASRRSTAAQASPSSPLRRGSRRKSVKEEPEVTPDPEQMDVDDEADGDDYADPDEDEAEADPEPEPGPSRRGRGRPKGSKNKSRRSKAEDTEDDEPESNAARRRSTKQVSYREVPVDQDEEAVEEEEPDEGSKKAETVSTPAPRRNRGRAVKDADKPYKKEPGTGGRGGFSVKGAAAAAARARWDKVRREKAERGEESDDGGERRRRPAAVIKRDPRGALENVVEGQKYSVKGTEYIAGDDELHLPANPKGDAKIDADGRLLGGREYKLVTFTSDSRRNKNRIYALTIDAARACGYSDSLAFLRRCPQIVKLSCDADERQMLIDVGRITGNLKHRMVTMVAMRNVYKLMGARLVKNGRWVDDDYNEDQALTDCTNNGWIPHGEVMEEELAVNQYPSAGGSGRPVASTSYADLGVSKNQLAGFYPAGGPTTHFGGSGADPWADVGHGHGRRGRMRTLGVSDEDWMLRTAEEARRVDETLRNYREERIGPLEGVDAVHGWVYAAEQRSSGEAKHEPKELETPSFKPTHPLAHEVSADASSEPLTPAPSDLPMGTGFDDDRNDAHSVDHIDCTPGGKVVVETVAETLAGLPRKGGKWQPGVIYAAYEMPHLPLRTQPNAGFMQRLSYQPLIGLNGDARMVRLPGIASVEYTFEPSVDIVDVDPSWLSFGDGTRRPDVVQARLAMVTDAEGWERAGRAKRQQQAAAAAAAPSV